MFICTATSVVVEEEHFQIVDLERPLLPDHRAVIRVLSSGLVVRHVVFRVVNIIRIPNPGGTVTVKFTKLP